METVYRANHRKEAEVEMDGSFLVRIIYEDEITYNQGNRPVAQELKCVVIGRSKFEENIDQKTHYVLIIGKRGDYGWERVGVGKLLGKSIALEGDGTDVTIS